jgi:hypothetical protein
MIPHSANNKQFLLVDVPVDSHSHEVYENNVVGGWCIMYLRGVPDYDCCYTGNLPPGSWQILCLASEATEEQAAMVVERRTDLKDHPYKGYEPAKLTVCWNAKQSLQSLLSSHSLDPKQVLIIEKQ